jgi:hypothetical protein
MVTRPSNVVDLNAFKAARTAARASEQLDLLEPALDRERARLDAERPLSDRDIAHRAQMLAHLTSAR